jgi:hypothetical protein
MLRDGKAAAKHDGARMSWPVIFTLSAMLTPPAAVGHGTPGSAFAPPPCGFRVVFPATPSWTKSTAADGGQDIAADLLYGQARFSAACIGSPPGRPVRPLPAADAQAQMLVMTRALGLQNAAIHPLPALGNDCGAVEGVLDQDKGAYRIAARLCIETGATFIVEVVYRSDLGLDDAAKAFLASLEVR